MKTTLSLVCLFSLLQPVALAELPDLISAGDASYGQVDLGDAMAGRDVILKGSRVMGNVRVGRDVEGSRCEVTGNIQAGRDATFDSCDRLGNLMAGRHANLRATQIQGDVMVGGEVRGESMRIIGTLMTPQSTLRLNQSQIGQIVIKQPLATNITNAGGVAFSGNVENSVIGSGTVVSGSSVVINGIRSGGGMASVAPGSFSKINGYSIQATSSQTTVMTPEGLIFVNGKKVYGDKAPLSYAQYQQVHPEAPSVIGPGWPRSSSGISTTNAFLPLVSPQLVSLTGNSVVLGDVVFESGHGIVEVAPGSRIQGRVLGGKIVKTQ